MLDQYLLGSGEFPLVEGRDGKRFCSGLGLPLIEALCWKEDGFDLKFWGN